MGKKALLVRLYPTSKQKSLLHRCCVYRHNFYKSLCMWYNETKDSCISLYKSYCEKEQDEEKRNEYSKSLPWPPKPFKKAKQSKEIRVSKAAFNDTTLRVSMNTVPKCMRFSCVSNFIDTPRTGKEKGIKKNYGDVFRLNSIYMPTVYGERIVDSSIICWCKDDFASSVNKTFSEENIGRIKQKNKERIAKGLKPVPCPPIHVKYPKYTEADSFKIDLKSIQVEKNNKGNVRHIILPFLTREYKKKLNNKNIERFSCALSESQLDKVTSVSAVTFRCNSAGEWYASLSVDLEISKKESTGLECGIDLGIKTTATVAYNALDESSTEYDKYEKIDLPVDKIKRLEERIAHLQKIQNRRIKTWVRLNKDGEAKGLKMNTDKNDKVHNAVFVYRKKYQSKSFKATDCRIAKLNVRIANIRKNFVEQTSRYIADKCDKVGLEDLNIKGMQKNHRLARSIARIGWSSFITRLKNKMGDCNVIQLNRFSPSSQVCSVCGFRNRKIKKLSYRSYICPECGKHHDRDCNAASNIRPSRKDILDSYCVNDVNK